MRRRESRQITGGRRERRPAALRRPDSHLAIKTSLARPPLSCSDEAVGPLVETAVDSCTCLLSTGIHSSLPAIPWWPGIHSGVLRVCSHGTPWTAFIRQIHQNITNSCSNRVEPGGYELIILKNVFFAVFLASVKFLQQAHIEINQSSIQPINSNRCSKLSFGKNVVLPN